MPFVPTPDESRRLSAAVEAARFTEGERVAWLTSLCGLLFLDVAIVAGRGIDLGQDMAWAGTAIGVLGAVGAFGVLYWRLRGGHLVGDAPDELRGLLGLNLATTEQRAFTGLMIRHALTGRNPLSTRPEHDPLAGFKPREPRAAADA